MKKNLDVLLGILNDLASINKERAGGYMRFIHDSRYKNKASLEILSARANKSLRFANDLESLLVSFVGHIPDNALVAGKIFHTWDAVQDKFCFDEDKLFAYECTCGEAAVLEAYKTALNSPGLYDYACRTVIMDQKYSLEVARDLVTRFSDFQNLATITHPSPPLLSF